jgi:hypothetical protein
MATNRKKYATGGDLDCRRLTTKPIFARSVAPASYRKLDTEVLSTCGNPWSTKQTWPGSGEISSSGKQETIDPASEFPQKFQVFSTASSKAGVAVHPRSPLSYWTDLNCAAAY